MTGPPAARPRPPAPFGSLETVVHARVVDDASTDLASAARHHAAALAPLLADTALDDLVAGVLARAVGLGPLEPLLADPEVTEVMVNAGSEVWCERAGRLERANIVLLPGQAELIVERVVAPLGLRIDRTSPVVDARLADGSRVHAIVAPLAVDGTCVSIRRFAVRAVPLDAFAPEPVARLLRWAVAAGANLVVSGATSSGKTTLLNALAAHVPRHERVITIEDAAELRLPGDHVVRLEARPATAEGVGGASVRDLVRAALRMRPDRLVVGEVRGGERPGPP
jgi:pilus assembly protein CpaF